MISINLIGGKYKYIFDGGGSKVLRYGEEWRDTTGDGFILAMAQRIEELEDALKESTKYFDQVIIETGYQSEGEAITHNKVKQVLNNLE